MAFAAPSGYTPEDLHWLRDEIGVAHLELDPWGSLIVSPTTYEHEMVIALLNDQAVRQLDRPGCVWVNGLNWIVPSGSGYLCVPDLTVMAPGWRPVGEYHVEPPPLMVAEVASRSTRKVDRGRKLADYRLGGAGLYLLVDPPSFTPSGAVGFEAHDFRTGQVTTGVGAIDLVVGSLPVRFDLTGLAVPPSSH